jgi:hypothetical protein
MVREPPWSRPLITAQALRFAELAKYQARSAGEVRSANKIMSDLLTAFWLGELTGVTFSGSLLDRAAILRGIAVQREQPGFALVEREEETSPAIDRRPGGGSINLRVRILLPADPVHWTEEIRNRVYADLAQRSIGDFADAVKLFLYSLVVQKEDYGAYCDRVGISRPYFWFGVGRQPGSSRDREMRGWLKEIFKRPRRPKAVVLAEARNKFPGISEAAVKRAWRDLAPPAWKQGGAPRKARRPGSAAK